MAAGWIRHVAKCMPSYNGVINAITPKKRGKMKPYRTLATVRLFTGVVGLTDDQVKWRANCLEKLKDDVYQITGEVCFKAGEMIGLEEAPKPFAKLLECLEPDPKPAVQPEPVVEAKKPVARKKRATTKRK